MSMAGYTKLFNSILASTIWRASDATRIVWITMLAMADKDGVVEGSVPGLADFARVTLDDALHALDELLAPDPYSRTEDNDGRRIEVLPGTGWRLLNHAKYRAKMGEDERREYNRKRQAEWRARNDVSQNVNDVSMTVNHNNACQDNTEAEADTKAKADKCISTRFAAPTQIEVMGYMQDKGIPNPKVESEKFVDFYTSKGWKVGHSPMKDWKAAVRNWGKNVTPAKGDRKWVDVE